jgi:hypothetical protein
MHQALEVIARATLNGQPLEVLWKPPFVYDVSGKLIIGVNELQVEVINLWPNRMIGDEQFPDDCTPDKSWTSGGLRAWPEWYKKKQARPDPRRISFVPVKMCKKDDPLLPSGLLGPVMLVPCSETEVSPKKINEKRKEQTMKHTVTHIITLLLVPLAVLHAAVAPLFITDLRAEGVSQPMRK